MRYSIMLQIVVGTTLILVGAGAFFGRLQTRPVEGDLGGSPRTGPIASGFPWSREGRVISLTLS